MKDIYIGNTDQRWFEFCKDKSPLSEVNFWQPSRQHFKAIDEGGIFFFRRKAPINKIAGFGILASSGTISIGQAWRDLGISNGVNDEEHFIELIRKYRKGKITDEFSQIGFKILINPVFLDERDWFDLPKDWSKNIVTGKSYSVNSSAGLRLVQKFQRLNPSANEFENDKYSFEGLAEAPFAGFSHTSAKQKIRMGQNAFRVSVLTAYECTCAVTGTSVESALEAAHILKFANHPDHSINNGILLRKDIHALFDRFLLTITEDYKISVNHRLRELYPDSAEYLSLDGKLISLPKEKIKYPSKNKILKRNIEHSLGGSFYPPLPAGPPKGG